MAAKKIVLTGTYQLPRAIGLTSACFGKSFSVEIAGQSGKAVLPEIAWNGDRPYIVAPTMDAELAKHLEHYLRDPEEPHQWGVVTGWRADKVVNAFASTIQLIFKVSASDLTYSEYLHGRGHPEAEFISQMFAEIEPWFDRLRTWLEVKVDQDLDVRDELQNVTVPGNGLQLLTVEGDIFSLPAAASSIYINTYDFQNASLPLLRRASKLASQGLRPSDAHLLLRDAAAALRRGYYRRAVIDSGSAAELTLADHNRIVTLVNIPKNGATLGWYVKQPAVAASAGLPADFSANVVDVRNNAIHNNVTPTLIEATVSLKESSELVRRLDPLVI